MGRPPCNAKQPVVCLLLESLEMGVRSVLAQGKSLTPHSQQCWQPEMIIVNNTQEDCAPLLRFIIELHNFHFFHP